MLVSPQKIRPCLWFDSQAEEAARFYVSIFRNSAIDSITHYDAASAKASGRPVQLVLTVAFQIEGQKFVALNGGPVFKLSEAVSFFINCDSQEEIDYYWGKLTEGGDPAAQIAAGSRTNTDSPGRSSRRSFRSCWPTPGSRRRSWPRCSR